MKTVGLVQAHHRGWGGARDFSLATLNGRYAVQEVIAQRDADGSDAPPLTGAGPDLRLTLARALMEAHAGTFDVVPGEPSGVRVRIGFPLVRVLKRSSEGAGATPADAAQTNTDDRLRRALVT